MNSFIDVRAAVRFSPNRPVGQLVADHPNCRLVVFGLEAGQAVRPHSSPSTVILCAMEGRGRLRVGDREVDVAPGHVAICEPDQTHAFCAAPDAPFVVLALIFTAPA